MILNVHLLNARTLALCVAQPSSPAGHILVLKSTDGFDFPRGFPLRINKKLQVASEASSIGLVHTFECTVVCQKARM